MMSLLSRIVIAGALLSVAGVADAAWRKASTRHFIIYSEQKPDVLRAYAKRLERFDRAVRVGRAMRDYEVGDGNRLTILVLADVDAVQAVGRGIGRKSAGFYIPRASGSIAVVPRSIESRAMRSFPGRSNRAR